MPIPTFSSPQPETNDAELRARFVREVRDVLAHIVRNDIEDGVNVRPVIESRTEAMQDAWEEVQPAFDQFQASLSEITDVQVTIHGLGGAQLRFKLGNVNYWSDRANAAATNQVANVWIGIVIRLLFSIDTLLDSLLAATGIGTAVKEAKDAIRDVIDLDI